MAFDPLTAVFDLVKTGVDKFLPDKMSEVEKTTLKNNMAMFVMTEAKKESSAFNQFILEYEGAAKDHGPFVKWLRGVIRPVLTIIISGAYIWGWAHPGTWTIDQMDTLNPAFLIVLAFWFGERAIKNTDIVKTLRKK
ncbi:MAG: hypothetical protein DRH26_05340 [Deltaproteobacteria bacterium]|nr:MAG: hypothetical protein DRH26_05340 [Deltaproteobacteria bacterium]